ncbi:hypothetical protein GCM10027341_16830 [Spirosoma knui]
MIVDSNIITYSIQPDYTRLLNYLVNKIDEIHVSSITKLEVLGFYKLDDSEKSQFRQFFDLITVLPISHEVITEAIRLRQQRKRSLADSIIAATALLYSLPVLTHNVADFADIDDLQLIALADVLNA